MTKTNAIVFCSIIVVGLVISYFTLDRFAKPVEVADEPVPVKVTEEPAPTAPEPEVKKPKPKVLVVEKPAKPEPPEPKSEGFASPAIAMKALVGTIGEKNFEAFTKLVGEDAIDDPIKEEVKALVESPSFILSDEEPFSEISKSATLVRWALNFEPVPVSAAEPQAVAPRQLYADLESVQNEAVDFKKISLPLLPAAVEGLGSPTANLQNDPLTIAHTFSKAVISRDFRVARALADPEKVTDERVAALMIAVEEGGFDLREKRPLVVTLSREDITWVLARITSRESSSEFALELGQDGGKWKIGGLTFSKVLSALAAQAGGGDVAYSPIVEDPSGGDSLVLYFEFDSAGVTPRGKRQLGIIADILSQGAERVIRINGHADALGTDQYNKGLSDGRAESIRDALVEMGVAPAQVITEAFGETKPRRPNFNPDGTDNPTGRSKNRRAEVYLDF
ncbi:MAG: OmpA family protein [Verrucomicrobiales bacterium]|nr:OmpA family protein [Verrucomicrobiales bacterium]